MSSKRISSSPDSGFSTFVKYNPAVILFIVDFYCAALKLVIEVDGESHLTEQGKQYDAQRTRILEGMD